MTESTFVHPFQKAGLGLAPFRCVAVTTNMWTSGCGTVSKPGGSCDYCGTGILYEYWIKSSDGKDFKVGCDCVRKTHATVAGFREARLKLAGELRAARREKSYAERRAQWAKEAAEKRLLFDSVYPGLAEKMSGYDDKFIKDLLSKLEGWGTLTPSQIEWANKVMDRIDERSRNKEADMRSVYVGEVKKPLDVTGEVFMCKSYTSSFYPFPMGFFQLIRSNGNVFVYSGSIKLPEKFSAKFTVKKFDEYQGVKQTVLSRPRNVVDLTPVAEEVVA